MRICLALILALAALGARAGSEPKTRQILDETTGNTVSVVNSPLVFARERSDVAAHARDYVTLVTTEVDHSGAFTEYLILYRWSTVDRRMGQAPGGSVGPLRLIAEGRIITLKPLERLPVDLSRRRELDVPRHTDVVTSAYATDLDTLRFIANSRQLSVTLPDENLDSPYVLFKDGRAALLEFLRQVAAP